MKNIFVILMLSTGVFAGLIDGTPHGNILSTRGFGDNGEICVFCHTPHAANKDIGGPVPLWNKPTSTLTFNMYGASTAGVAGSTLAGTATDEQPTDQSLACLSCHDGVSAMNSVINAPGAGNSPNGTGLIGESSPSSMPNSQFKAIGAPKAIGWDGYNTIYGTDGALENDHPISIVYTPGRGSLKEVDAELINFFGATKISDLLRDGKVQCVSCHDPHGTGNARYLRNNNYGSTLCLGCHDK